MKYLREYGLSVAALTVMIGVSLWAWPRLAEPLPVHWGLSGEPDRYGSKLEALSILPAVVILLIVMFGLLKRADRPDRSVIAALRSVTVLGFAGLHVGLVASYLGSELSVIRLVSTVVGFILVGVGNVLPKLEPNPYAGIRLPWTFASRRSWYRTQRAGGWVMVVIGLMLLGAALTGLPEAVLTGLVLSLLVSMLGLVGFAYLEYRKDGERSTHL